MKLSDIITPQELCKAFSEEEEDIFRLGQRTDLIQKYIETLCSKLEDSYCQEIYKHVPNQLAGSAMLRLLALINKHLEEKHDTHSAIN